MDNIFNPITTKGLYFPALPAEYGDNLSYLEMVAQFTALLNKIMEQCNLNTNDKNKLYEEWGKHLTESEKNIKDINKKYDELYKEFVNAVSSINAIYQNGKTLFNNINDWCNTHKDFLTAEETINNCVKGYYDKLTTQVITSNLTGINNSDYIIYEAVLANNTNEELTNVPVKLKVSFSQGECTDIGNITVSSSTRAIIPFQLEEIKNTNPFLTRKITHYKDGTLKGGTIWFFDSIGKNETKRYRVMVHEESKDYHFNDNINVMDTDDKITMVAQDKKIIINKQNFKTEYFIGNNLLSYNGNRQIVDPYWKNTDGDIDVLGGTRTCEYKITGSGVVYKEIKITYHYEKIDIEENMKFFNDGTLMCDILYKINETTTDIKGIGCKCYVNKELLNSTTNDTSKGEYSAYFTTADKLNINFVKCFLQEDYGEPVSGQFGTKKAIMNEDSKEIGINTYNSINSTLTNESIFRIELTVTPSLSMNTCNNMPVSICTKYSAKSLKQRLINNYKKFIGYMPTFQFSELFKPLIIYVNFCHSVFFERKINYELIGDYLNELNTKYNISQDEGLKNAYLGGKGIEFIGRDCGGLMLLYKLCKKLNYTLYNETIEKYIKNLALFFVWCENYSGGNGKIKLKHDFPDTLNSEATAIKFLHYQSTIESNTIITECYTRILTHFNESIIYNNLLPYSPGGDIVCGQQEHYQAFALYDLLEGITSKPGFSLTQYAYTIINPIGKIDEMGAEYTSRRFGFAHSSLYWSSVLAQEDTISSLEMANLVVENLLSKCFPTGGHMTPIDNWKDVNNGSIDQVIEVSICYNNMLKEIL